MDKKFNARIQHKIDIQENWEKAINFIPLKGEWIFYDKDANNTNIRLKIGDGKTTVNDLPFISTAVANNPNGGAASPQIQSDYNQNDDSQIDYIKNRPFYTLPAEHNFNLGLNRTFEEYVWDGDITTNRYNFSVEFQGTKISWYKVSDTFYGYEDILNGCAYISAVPEDELEEMREYGIQSYLIPVPLTEDILNMMILYKDSHCLIGSGMISTDTPVILSLPNEDGGTIELNIQEPGTYYTYDETGSLFGVPGTYVKQIVGPADVLNDPNFIIVPDIYGPGTYLAFKKVSELFFTQSQLINSLFTTSTISYTPDEIFNGMCVQQKISQDVLNDMEAITSSTDNSYACTAAGIPLFASFETDSGEINGMIPGKGTYLMYSDTGSASGGMVLYVDNFNSGETIFQIDPKYIPKTKIKTTENIESGNETPVSSQGIYAALGNRSMLYIEDYVGYGSNPISCYGVYQALGYRERLPDIVTEPENTSYTHLISSYGVYQGLRNINDYLGSNDYAESSYTTLKYRGSNLRPISQENSYDPDYNGTILWFYE